jgi:hypothetical protein
MPQKIIIVLDGLNVSFLISQLSGYEYKKGTTELARLSEDMTQQIETCLKIS